MFHGIISNESKIHIIIININKTDIILVQKKDMSCLEEIQYAICKFLQSINTKKIDNFLHSNLLKRIAGLIKKEMLLSLTFPPNDRREHCSKKHHA